MKKKGIRSRLGILPVKGHRDFNATACPGDRFPMSEIVASVENETESEQEECEVKLRLLGKGDSGNSVKSLQQLLIARGHNCGGFGADGKFGAGTESSVTDYQRANGLTIDGLVGDKTWGSLLL